MLMLTSVAAASARLLASDLAARAVPLAAPPRPATALVQHGCTRVDGIVSAEHCRRLKRHIFALQAVATLPSEEPADLRHIPGTRIRFREAIDCAFAGSRSDILLPTEDPLVAETLRLVLGALHSTLQAGGLRLPLIENSGTGDRASSAASGATAAAEAAAFEADAGRSDLGVGLELVECACLVSRPGSTHQEIHSDYRRDLPLQQPPRLVAFLYLQDTPTVEHGATIFLPDTATAAAHAAYYDAATAGGVDGTAGGIGAAGSASAPRCATLRAGDVAVYDASLLHFGSANSVQGNQRAVMYLGVAREGETEVLAPRLSAPTELQAVEPLTIARLLRGRAGRSVGGQLSDE